MGNHHRRGQPGPLGLCCLLLAVLLAGCATRRGGPTAQPSEGTGNREQGAGSTPQPLAPTPYTRIPTPFSLTPTPSNQTVSNQLVTVLPPLPAAFQYQVDIKPANAPSGEDTRINGQYRAGAWQQSAQTRAQSTSTQPAQDMVAISGTTYTRPGGAPVWTRWPGISFDAAYGLTSPFTVLRLFPVADRKVRGPAAQIPGAPAPTYRTQTEVSAATLRQLLEAGAATVAPDAATRATLMQQVAPLAITQTITYWATDAGQVYRAAATLVSADGSGQATPWMQVTWLFWSYLATGQPIAAPAQYQDAPSPEASARALPTSTPRTGAGNASLQVRVFASPGTPAEDLAVTIYPAGDNRQPLDWRNQADAQFVLPPGRYDVLIQMDYAQQWLHDVEVGANAPVSRDVTFDFGTLSLTVLRGGNTIPVDIVTYPAGNHKSWVDWRSENPATVSLRAGLYDVEIAYDNYKGHRMVTNLRVNAGQITSQVIDLPQ